MGDGTTGATLAPRPPSPAHSTTSSVSKFHEELDDDRVSVVPPSPPDDEPPSRPRSPQTEQGAGFFGSGERSADGLRLLAKRFRSRTHSGGGARPSNAAGERRTRVLSVERPSFEVSVTPPTPSTALGLGLPPKEESKADGKRKASDPDSSMDSSEPTEGGRRVHTTSSASNAPSAYRTAKRIRLSTPHEEAGSSTLRGVPHGLEQLHPPPRPSSRASTAYTVRTNRSIPVRAIVSPRPPSIAGSNRTFHMRDPTARPPPPVGWRPLSAVLDEEIQVPVLPSARIPPPRKRSVPWTAWAFYLGFVLFPLWWIAAFSSVSPWPGREKPNWAGWLRARDERAWRKRNRWMSIVGLIVYIPIIVLAAVFGGNATVTE